VDETKDCKHDTTSVDNTKNVTVDYDIEDETEDCKHNTTSVNNAMVD